MPWEAILFSLPWKAVLCSRRRSCHGRRFTNLINDERQELWFLSLLKIQNTIEREERGIWLLKQLWGLVQIDNRESCMDSTIVLQMRTLDALVHLTWLGPRIFRGQRPREGPISNKKTSRRAEEPHLAMLDRRRGDLRGVAPQGTFDHLVAFSCSRVSSE